MVAVSYQIATHHLMVPRLSHRALKDHVDLLLHDVPVVLKSRETAVPPSGHHRAMSLHVPG